MILHPISRVVAIYSYIVMARVILSWVSLSAVRGGILAKIAPPIYALTEPLLRPIRRALAPYQRNMPLDFSPLVLFRASSGRGAFSSDCDS